MSAIKKAVKGVGKFVKRHWKKIAIAAAVVFTAGAATMGIAGMKAAFAAKGLMGTLGTVMKTGVGAIGKVVGIGKGAAGASTQVASAGAKVASTGLSATKAGATASKLAAGLSKGIGTAKAVGGANAAAALAAKGAAQAAVPFAGMAGAATKAITPTLMSTAGAAAPAAAKAGFWSGLGGQALITGGIGAAQALLAGQNEDEDDPKGFYGVDMQGKASLSPNELSFSDADITGGASSFRRKLMYDPPTGG